VTRFRRLLLILFAAAAVFAVMVYTTPYTHLFFKSVTLAPSDQVFTRVPGAGYMIFMAYLFTTLAAGVVYIVRNRKELSVLDRRRALIILIAVLIPVLAGGIDVFRAFPRQGVSLASIAILISVGVLIYGMVRTQLLSPVPIAHKAMIDEMAEPVLVLDDMNRIVYGNPSAHALVQGGKLAPRVLFEDMFPGVELHNVKEATVRVRDFEYLVSVKPILVKKEHAGAVVLLFHDVTRITEENARLEALVIERNKLLHETNRELEEEITRYREAQAQLEELVSQKEVLLREVHHRVKNNLQIVMTMMQLQISRLGNNEEMRMVCDAMKNRIRSISLVHERLYRTAFNEALDFGSYVTELVADIGRLYLGEGVETRTDIRSGRVEVGIDFCVNFGLVLNELLANSIKHGIMPAGSGKVTVSLSKEGDTLVLSVRDTGRGFPADHPLGEGKSLGMSIINSILASYKATLGIRNENGAVTEIVIPWQSSSQ
jgi:two-component sensor histidine kinase